MQFRAAAMRLVGARPQERVPERARSRLPEAHTSVTGLPVPVPTCRAAAHAREHTLYSLHSPSQSGRALAQ